ncbi:outer membrane protein assembly factor BamB [Methylomonas paludis]|uniref:Outer membrane protein assembly factor BamB n=1 Tax=Methylomonas paludis TaxID=1173101 RepID=A0A975MKH2_9GAMM|nr:outer membrane protein assembly factor BamB [Methylomonas paludis]QWF69481.1 outer membrane protein assembly factor BamB [Methylomonas paludis]
MFLISYLRLSVVAIALSSLLLLSACAGMETLTDMMTGLTELFSDDDTADPPAILAEDFQGETQVDMLWKENVGKGADQKNLKLIPVVANNRLFVADYNGRVQARETGDGELVWENKTEYTFAAGPGLGAELVIMGTSHGEVVAFDRITGLQKWSTPVSSEVLAVPVVAHGKVIIRTTDGKIIALREADGGFVWVAEYSVPALSIRGAGTPLVFDDKVIAGAANGKLIALQLVDGKTLWETTIAIPTGRSEVERLVDLDVDPIEARGSLFIASYQSGTASVAEGDGDVLWRNESVSTYTGISADWRYLYISDSHGEVWQLDQRSGASLWKQKELHNRQLSAAIAYQNYVVAGDFEGYVHWLSTNDGKVMGRIKLTKAPIETKPVIADGIVYIYAKDGTLAALKAR